MEAIAVGLTCTAFPHAFPSTSSLSRTSTFTSIKYPSSRALHRSKGIEEQELYGLPKEYYDDEWQAQQREKTKELHRLRQQEDEEEERKVDEYREIGLRLKDYPEEELQKAKKLIASFIRSAEEVEEKIEEAAEKGELDELVLLIIWNRLDLARRDDEKDAVRSLDLLYRRVEAEILKREATPAMRLLNDLLNMHDGGLDNERWLKACKKLMVDTFPQEDPFSILVPAGFDIDKHQGPLRIALEADDVLLRVDFVREVDELLKEVRSEQTESLDTQGLVPESVASRFVSVRFCVLTFSETCPFLVLSKNRKMSSQMS